MECGGLDQDQQNTLTNYFILVYDRLCSLLLLWPVTFFKWETRKKNAFSEQVRRGCVDGCGGVWGQGSIQGQGQGETDEMGLP